MLPTAAATLAGVTWTLIQARPCSSAPRECGVKPERPTAVQPYRVPGAVAPIAAAQPSPPARKDVDWGLLIMVVLFTPIVACLLLGALWILWVLFLTWPTR